MVTYPIHIPRKNYRGRDPKKTRQMLERHRIASDMESKINALLLQQKEPIRTYLWMEISRVTGYSFETVQDLGYGIDGGSNGFTAWRHDLTYEQANAVARGG